MRGLFRKIFFIFSTGILILCFQNFSYHDNLEGFEVVDPELLNPNFGEETSIATPQSGQDLGSVASDWSRRQKDILLQGRDQVILDGWNEKLKSFFSAEDGEELAEESTDQPAAPKAKGSRQPASVRMVQFNKVEYRVSESSLATCTYDGRGAEFLFSKDFGGSKLVLRHQSAEQNTTVNFNLPF